MPRQPNPILEATIEEAIQDLYKVLFNHSLSQVTCSHMAENVVAIVLESTTTLPETVLLQSHKIDTAKAFRHSLNSIFERYLRAMLTNAYERDVHDLLGQYQYEVGCMSFIIILGKKTLSPNAP